MNKIEALESNLADAHGDLERAQRQVTYLTERLDLARSDQPVSADGSPTHCGGCGADVSTERLFSEHYVIPDRRLTNIGHCPTRH